MSKTIYYIGAGASYGIRENGVIIEGIPVVKEIPSEFAAFRKFIEDAKIPMRIYPFRICIELDMKM